MTSASDYWQERGALCLCVTASRAEIDDWYSRVCNISDEFFATPATLGRSPRVKLSWMLPRLERRGSGLSRRYSKSRSIKAGCLPALTPIHGNVDSQKTRWSIEKFTGLSAVILHAIFSPFRASRDGKVAAQAAVVMRNMVASRLPKSEGGNQL